MKKLLILISFIFILILMNSTISFASDSLAYAFVESSNSEYDTTFKIFNNLTNSFTDTFYANDKLGNYGVRATSYKDGRYLPTVGKWSDNDYIIKEGAQIVELIVSSPIDKSFIIKISINGMANPNIFTLENEDDELLYEEPEIFTTLTADILLLNIDTSYDINLENKNSDSTYTWHSDNPKIAKVNSKNGVVTGLKEGKTAITCNVNTNGKTYLLKTDVIIGNDDNFPILSDTELNLEVGDKYDIDIENSISKAKYKWSTSDKTVVKVNSSTGAITAIKEGVANIYCTITTQDRKVTVLKCEIIIN